MDSNEKYTIFLNHEGNDLEFEVDSIDMANLLLNDHEAAHQFIRAHRPDLFEVVFERGEEETPNNDESDETPGRAHGEMIAEIWTKRKPTAVDLEATSLMLSSRQKLADILKNAKFNIGCNGTEKCRQKFANLTKAYLGYIKHQKKTGEGRRDDVPPFFDEVHSILGSKHKINPNHLEDTFEDQNPQEPETTTEPEQRSDIGTDVSQSSTSTSNAASDRFKNIRKKIKPKSKSQYIIEELQHDRKLKEEQFSFFKQHMQETTKQRASFLKILERAFPRKRKREVDSDSDSE